MASVASAPESPVVQTMLRMPNIRLMSFTRAEALTRIFPNLVRLVLPQGVFDIAENIPPNDVAAFVTWAQEKGYPFELREIALAHGVRRRYGAGVQSRRSKAFAAGIDAGMEQLRHRDHRSVMSRQAEISEAVKAILGSCRSTTELRPHFQSLSP